MKRRCVIDEGIGETRAAIYEGRKLVELYLRRWSDQNLPRLGDRFVGKISDIDSGLGAAFVDLGQGPDGFLKFTDAANAPRFQQGQYVDVDISRESEGDKGPVLKFRGLSDVNKVGPVSQSSLKDQLRNRYSGQIEFEVAPISNLNDICLQEIAMDGGGDISIEPTRALIAVDVDRGTGPNGFEVSIKAAKLIASQLRLRGLGGLIAIDFPNLRQKKQRDQLYEAMNAAVIGDPNVIKIAPLSRFGVMEMTRQKKQRSLDDVILDRFGRPKVESMALQALQRLENEAKHAPGAKLTLMVPAQAYEWLEEDSIDWRSAMTDRIGARFSVVQGNVLDVKADR